MSGPRKFSFPAAIRTDGYDPAQLTVNPYAAEDQAVMQDARLTAEKTARQQKQKANVAAVQNPANPGAIDGPQAEGDPATGTGSKSADDYAAMGASAAKGASAGDQPWVYRRTPETGLNPNYKLPDPYAYSTRDYGNSSTLDLFNAEYQKRILADDPVFKDWLARRAAVAFDTDLYDDKGKFDILAGEKVWAQFGAYTAANPNLRNNYTPEQYADMIYNKYGGDDAYDAFSKAKADAAAKKARDENPISTSTSTHTSYNVMPGKAADAAADQLARALLGRMGGEKELARYRSQINAFLKANPSVSKSTTVSNADTKTSKTTSTSTSGASPSDAMNILEMKMRRGSEGMAFNIGQMFDAALAKMDKGL